jgi:ribosomal protein S12 methylthiotransferase accessory factor
VKPLLHRGAANRLGIVAAPEQIPTTLADVPGVFHASVRSPYGVSGGVGWDRDSATTAAVGEGLERFSAAAHPLPTLSLNTPFTKYTYDAFSLFSPEQLADPHCPWRPSSETTYVGATRLDDAALVGVPRSLASLSDPQGEAIATSNGLAAGPTMPHAIERGLQEVIERDALMTAWLHGLAPQSLDLPQALANRIAHLGADIRVLDLTPIYSPWPVVAVCGSLPWRGRPRIGLGAACRATYSEAIEKAFLEWSQATVFVGVQMAFNRLQTYESADAVTTFEDHALYYSAHPQEWSKVPFWSSHSPVPIPQRAQIKNGQTKNDQSSASNQADPGSVKFGNRTDSTLAEVRRQDSSRFVPSPDPTGRAQSRVDQAVSKLNQHNLSVLTVDLTIPEVRELGVHVSRVLVPGLLSVNPDHRWPYLGGTAALSRLRFPTLDPHVAFPSPFPHPLG